MKLAKINPSAFSNSSRLPRAMAVVAMTLAAVVTARADVVFDDISNYENSAAGASATTTGSTPNTFMGGGYTLTPGTTDITGFDLFPVNLATTTYTDLKVNIYVWGTVNTGPVTVATPAFSNLLGTYTDTLAAGTYTSGFFYPVEASTPGASPGFALPTPLSISSTTIGVTFNVQGTTDGTTYNNVNSLTSLITYGTLPTVGTSVFNGYYRNGNSEVNGNFTAPLHTLGATDQGLAMRVFGDVTPVPEPTSIALLGAGAGGLLVLRRLRRA